MDNSGAYTTYGELFERLYPSTYVSEKSSVTLSNKAGSVFEYAGNGFDLQDGDIVTQGEYVQTITQLQSGPDKLTLDDATNIINGSAQVFRLGRSIADFTMFRSMAMQLIDLHTGQWFNKRDLTISYEGDNSWMIHFSVPIIEITSLKKNNSSDALETTAYKVYNSRTLPDDRRNPKIKLISDTRNIYTQTDFSSGPLFSKGRFNEIIGSFGFLEDDGSTPEAIKWITARLVMKELTRDPEGTTGQTIKREKTDMHEVEYDIKSGSSASDLHGKLTGDVEVDRLLQLYKAPLAIGGTDPLYSAILPFYRTI